MSKKLKPRDKITQKMSRDGLIEVNETAGTAELVSGREQDADFSKQPEQAAQEAVQQLPHPSGGAAARPHTPELSPKRDDAAAERVLEHIDAAHTRAASKKAIKRAQREAAAKTKTSRLQFTEEERTTPELQKAIRKSERAADRLDEARAAIPKKKVLTKERTFDEAAGKGKTRLRFEEKEKPIPGGRQQHNPLSRPVQEIGVFVHNKIHSVEKDNSGVEGAHKSEELAERGIRAGARQMRKSRRSRKLKPYRAAAKAEKAAFKANADFQYQKALHDNPQLAVSNPVSRFWQKQQIKRQYAKAVRTGGAKSARKAAENTRKAAKKTAEATKKTAAFVGRHWKAFLIAGCALLLLIMLMSAISSGSALFSGLVNGVIGTSYTSEDSDLVAVENNYAAKENDLQSRIDNIERDYPGYDEYRYDLAYIGHNPHELASYLTALLQSYTPQSAQAELDRIFNLQYKLTVTEEIEVRYRTERRTGSYTDAEGNTHTYTYTVEVPYNYYITDSNLNHTGIYLYSKGKIMIHLTFDYKTDEKCTTPGQYLKYHRTFQGLSTRELAEKVGIVPATLVLYENDRHPIKYSTAVALANVLGIDRNRLLDEYTAFVDYPYFSLLKKVRQDLSLTQIQMAELIGIGQTSYSGWEREIRVPRRKEYDKILAALKKLRVNVDTYLCQSASI